MIELKTTIEIEALPSKVWEVLIDFNHHPDWNPFAVSISGKLAVGEKVRMRLNRPRKQHMPMILLASYPRGMTP